MNYATIINAIGKAAKKMSPIDLCGRTCGNVLGRTFTISPELLELLPDEFIKSGKAGALLKKFEGLPTDEVIKRLKSEGAIEKVTSNGDSIKLSSKIVAAAENVVGQKQALRGKMLSHFSERHLAAKQAGNFSEMAEEDFLHGNLAIKLGEKGKQFDAHGMAKGLGPCDIYDQLDNLLTNGIDKKRPFYTAPLDVPLSERAGGVDVAGGVARREGPFIVVGAKGESILDSGIKYVVLNKSMYPFADDFAKVYPNVKFIKMEDANSFFSAL